jgi:hypothetical protein
MSGENGDAERGQQRDEAVELGLRLRDHEARVAKASDERHEARGEAGDDAGDDRMAGGHDRPLEPPDDDFFERVPFVMGVDGRCERGGRIARVVLNDDIHA